MPYIEGFITPVPKANREAYLKHAREAYAFLGDFGMTRMAEHWAQDVRPGKVTGFPNAVHAHDDEDVVFSWFEYPDRATRDAANARMMEDPRLEAMMGHMPFDMSRMVMGGFASILDEGTRGAPGYVDGVVVPVPDARRDDYLALAKTMAAQHLGHGALRVVEAWSDDLQDGQVTDFRRAVLAKPGESVVFAWIEWPDKATRDAGWAKLMADESLQPTDMPFDGQRMFWGGFEPLVDVTPG